MSSDEIILVADIPVRLVKSTKAKHILLKQNTKGEIILTCPRFCPKMMAITFAKGQAAWIRAHVQYGPKETIFSPKDVVTILGEKYALRQGKTTQYGRGVLTVSGSPEFFHRRVCSCAQNMLLSYIQSRVGELTKKLGVKAGRITLKNTSSRWGSCSSSKNLSFCWKIAFAPLNVIDYLVIHEVSHLVQMNHGAKFWGIVDSLTKYRQSAEKWLKTNGRYLQSIK